jgi:hypothetical protein
MKFILFRKSTVFQLLKYCLSCWIETKIQLSFLQHPGMLSYLVAVQSRKYPQTDVSYFKIHFNMHVYLHNICAPSELKCRVSNLKVGGTCSKYCASKGYWNSVKKLMLFFFNPGNLMVTEFAHNAWKKCYINKSKVQTYPALLHFSSETC